jgi:uncharacterized membrane protein required for colicin V production
MSITLLDALIIVALIVGLIGGWQKGVLNEAAAFVGTIAIIVVAWLLKGEVSVYLYKYLPFFKLGGDLKGLSSLNILIYEFIAFLAVSGVLALILGVVLKLTGAIENVLKATILLRLPSRILGAALGFCEAYLLVFVALCVLNQPFVTFISVNDSKFGNKILDSTPVFSTGIDDAVNSGEEIYVLIKNKDKYTTEELDYKTLEILLKDKIVKPDAVDYLISKDKINIAGATALADTYR